MATLLGIATLTLLTSALSLVEADSASQPALLPAVHPEHDKADLQHLLPQDNHNLYYSHGGISDPTLEHTFAQLSTKLSHPAIILDYSSYIKSVQCAGQDLKIIFTDSEGYDFAKKAWTNETDFILATYTSGCGTLTDQRTFWLIDHLVPGNSNTITAVVQHEVAIENALHEVDLVWGTYQPAQGSKKRTRSILHKRQDASGTTAGACGSPSSRQIDGLPAATCGSATFDKDLDDAIGYFDFDAEHYSESMEGFVPGLGDFASEDNEGFGATVGLNGTRLNRRDLLAKRSGSWLNRIATKLARTVNRAAEALSNLPAAVAQGVKEVAQKVSDALAVSPAIALNYDLKAYGPKKENLTKSPFGDNDLLLYQGSKTRINRAGGVTGEFSVYCHECGVYGKLNIAGAARWTIKDGLTQANVMMNGDIQAGLQLDLSGEVNAYQQISKAIINQGIPGLSVTNVFSIGPSIYIDAEARLNVSLSGSVLAGVKVTIPVFSASLDFVGQNSSLMTDFTPRVEKIFQAQAQVSVDMGLGIPLGLAIGLSVPPAKNFKAAVTLSNRPALTAVAKFTAGNTGQEGNTCLNGINYGFNFVNTLSADIFGLKQYKLSEKTVPIANDCFRFGSRKRALIDDHSETYSPSVAKRQESSSDSDTTAAAPASSSDAPLAANASNSLADTSMFANSNITEAPTNATANDAFFQALNQTAFESLDAVNGTLDTSVVPYPSNTDFITIRDLSGNDELDADADGNIYYADPGNGSVFAVVSGFVEGDGAGRFFHYYTDTMEKYNVSRLRLSKEQHIPLTSDFVGFAPINYNNDATTADVFVAVDTVDGVFFPVTCDIQNQPSKAFLVTDIAQGTQKLLDPLLRNTVTGGIVEKCYFLPWAAPAGSGVGLPAAGAPAPAYPLSVSGIDLSASAEPVSTTARAGLPTGQAKGFSLTGAATTARTIPPLATPSA